MVTRFYNGTAKSQALQTCKPLMMLLQLKGRRCQIALDLSMARWGLYPGLENSREIFAMVFEVLFLSYFILMLLEMISVYLNLLH